MARSPSETSVDYRHPHRPPALAVLNRAAARVDRATGLVSPSLAPDDLLAASARRTGLDDFGDPGFREPLGVLTRSIEAEARLHPVGKMMARENLLRVLSNRLRIEQDSRDPAVAARRMPAPVVITGLQRTGTTLLHRLLHQDPRLRCLLSWEAVNPAPWRRRSWQRRDPRIDAARLAQASVRWLAPDFFAVHPVEADSPEEDVLLLEYSLVSTVPEATMHVPAYSRWVESADHRPAYEYLEKTLVLLLERGPFGRWVLKSPHHLEHLDALLAVFPGARIVQTHRDPTVTLASFCSMVSHARGIFSDEPDPREVGRHWLRKQVRMLDRASRTRDLHADSFLDVRYEDLVGSPVREVARIYEWLGMDLDAAVEARMRAWLRHNPRHRHGRHRYHLASFGLTREQVREAFAPYLARAEVPSEPDRRAGIVVRDREAPVTGRTCLVTGATSGHGLAVATALARLGADVVLLGRDEAKLEDTRARIAALTDRVPETLRCDLASLTDVRRAAAEYLDSGRPLHVLVDNAGVVQRRRTETEDGIETTLAVNFLSHFLLTRLLLDRIRESGPARILLVSSDTHRIVEMDTDDIQLTRGYGFMKAYGLSKLCMVLFTLELARRLDPAVVTVNALDPGPVRSSLAQNNPGLARDVLRLVMDVGFPPAEEAARTCVWLATSPDVAGVTGGYYRSLARRRPRVKDPSLAPRLWDIAEDLTGLR